MLSQQFTIDPPELTRDLADKIAHAAKEQLETSIRYKTPRLSTIKEIEDLYFGIAEKQLKNPFNESFPFMSGAVDYGVARIDDPPRVKFKERHDADYKAVQKIQSAWDAITTSTLPDNKWPLKDRWGKKLGLMSGRTIHKYFAESPQGKYRSVFSTVDYKLFHCQPDGGGHLEYHLFCGEEGIYKTRQELEKGAELGYYDKGQVDKLIENTTQDQYQENAEDQNELHSRQEALGLDPKTHAYIGQEAYHLVEWYLTYNGVRWYCLFDKHTATWIRIKPLSELMPVTGQNAHPMWPYVSWATHEDMSIFWSKGNGDDWRPIAKFMNRLLNQELYNREKMNKGQRLYDPEMVLDVGALADWRPDGLVPVRVPAGKSTEQAVHQFDVAGLNGTLDLASYIEQFVGRNTGNTPGSRGAAESDKKVGIYFGELQQIDEYIGTRNKSYKEAYEELAQRFIQGLDEHLDGDGIEVELMGPHGTEWDNLTKKDMKRNRDPSIFISGGLEEEEKNVAENRERREVLSALRTVNPQWQDEQLLRTAPFEEDDIKEAFNYVPNASKMLMSEATQAFEDIKAGKTPKVNLGANTAYMQRLIDLEKNADDLDEETRKKILEYTMEHVDIVVENESRNAVDLLQRQAAGAGADERNPSAGGAPSVEPDTVPTEEQFKQTPKAAASAAGARAREEFMRT